MAQRWDLSEGGAEGFATKFLAVLDDSSRKASEKGEKQLAQTFWRDFLVDVCGIADPTIAGVVFEYPVRQIGTDTVGWIDVLWPGVVLIEHKSPGKDLDIAEGEARDYLLALEPRVRPPVIIVSDFRRVRIVEVIAGRSHEFALEQLPSNLNRFEIVLGQAGHGAAAEALRADEKAAQLMGDLYVAFEDAGYHGHEVSVFLVRVLFLLFGDDTRLWSQVGELGMFGSVVDASNRDGSGLGGTIQELFGVLDQPREGRPKTIAKALADFPYANGGLFAEVLPVFSFDYKMREALLAACAYDWSSISPHIFGAMFQDIKSQEARRELGEHFTSEENILKVIGPLFLDELNARLVRDWDSAAALRRFHDDLATYQWLDPACGCGNFLVVAYRRVRDIELRLLARLVELEGKSGRALFVESFQKVKLAQFHGIEYLEWSSQIASVALFLSEHQANQEMDRLLGIAPSLLPLRDTASIVTGNSLRMDWSSVCPMSERTFVMGNPPFVGSNLRNAEQTTDQAMIWGNTKGAGALDYVTNWFLIAARFATNSGCRVSFVATNSVSQGEQVLVLWTALSALGIVIDFAHQAFTWHNGSGGEAAVHTVIEGFSASGRGYRKQLWIYETPNAEPVLTSASNINAYLMDAPSVLVTSRRTPLVKGVPPLVYGNMPNDGGALSKISRDEADFIRATDSIAAQYLRPLIGADEMLNGGDRWCLWLKDADPSDLRNSPELRRRVGSVYLQRSSSKREATRKGADRPWEFQEIRQPQGRFIAVPRVTSQRRRYLPCQYFDPSVIVNDQVFTINDNSLETFGIISSRVFRIWADAVSGRLKSDLRLSAEVTYNNFPWPQLSNELAGRIENAADRVLRVRGHLFGEGRTTTLSDLYDPITMPKQLQEAHADLDRAVLAAVGLRANATKSAILSRLFELYQELIGGTLLDPVPPPKKRRAA